MENIKTDPTDNIQEAAAAVLTDAPGTYALVVRLDEPVSIIVGRLGSRSFPAGHYVYLGSALGPGGTRARLNRHLRQAAASTLHWHIDYLLRCGMMSEIWWASGSRRQECAWSVILAQIGEVYPRGFGSSDCRCRGHLVAFHSAAALREARQVLRQETGSAFEWMSISPASTEPYPLEGESHGETQDHNPRRR
jgi:Uri superfamily endonuclease